MRIKPPSLSGLRSALVAAVISMAAPGAAAAPPPVAAPPVEHGHAHDIEPAPPTDEAMREGGWRTDAPLRQAMQAILDAVVTAVRVDGNGPALAAELRRQVDYMVANCKLDPAADAALHGIIADLLRAAGRLDAGATPAQEHDELHAALARYGGQFDHPDWPLR
jgi:hypothetical protein